MIQRIERQFAGRPLTLEIGRMAKLAGGSCLVQYGETVVLCRATAQNKPTTAKRPFSAAARSVRAASMPE